jgi:hypothetical protein
MLCGVPREHESLIGILNRWIKKVSLPSQEKNDNSARNKNQRLFPGLICPFFFLTLFFSLFNIIPTKRKF